MYSRSLSPTHGGDMGVKAIVIDSVFLSLATIAISIRLYSRKLQRHSLLLNDYAAMLAWVRTMAQHHHEPPADNADSRS